MLGQKAVCQDNVLRNQLCSMSESQQLVMLCIARYLVAGKPLEPVIPRVLSKDVPGQEKHLGMVTTDRIGQSACLPSKCAMAMHMMGRHRLNGCRWESQHVIATLPVVFLLKVQSIPFRKTGVFASICKLSLYHSTCCCFACCDVYCKLIRLEISDKFNQANDLE